MDAGPVIARGHNVAVFVPPVTEAALPVLQAATRRPMLILTPDADRAVSLAFWDAVFAVSALARAQQRLSGGPPDIMAIGAADALGLLRRSSLQPAGFTAVVIAWPEQFDEDASAALEALLAECDKDAQRILLTADSGTASRVIERYLFKAMTYGFPTADGATPPTLGPARYVVARASQLADVRRRVLDALNPQRDDQVRVVTCPASRDQGAALMVEGAEPPVVVVEAHQLPWLRTLFNPLSNLVLPTSSDAADQRAEKLRGRISRVAETENLDRELFILGPLFERYDPSLVAAAALKLVAGQGGQPAVRSVEPAGPAAPAGVPSFAKVWVGVGRKDNVKPGDLVGAIVNETKVPADALGKIEVRDLFCLVDVRADQAEKVAQGLTGVQLRGRRLTARVDRGPGPGGRPPRRA